MPVLLRTVRLPPEFFPSIAPTHLTCSPNRVRLGGTGRDAVPGRAVRSIAKLASIVSVSVYLVAHRWLSGGWVSRRKFAGALGRRLLARLGPPFSIEIAEVAHDEGHCC
jgi:hypothetical protein